MHFFQLNFYNQIFHRRHSLMKKRFLSILLVLCLMLTLLPAAAMAADTATPSKTSFVMSGQPVSVTAAYSINGTNYLQLRAIAAMLNGTAAQFDVGWDGQYAVIEPGKPYSGTITDTQLQNTTNVRKSGTKFKLNGQVFAFTDARLIDGDTNYLQLREFAQKLAGTQSQFDLYWDENAGKAVVEPGKPYKMPAAATVAPAPVISGKAPIIDMVHVPAGNYKAYEVPVTLTKGYYVGKYEVTQEQYQAVMGTNPSYFDGVDDNWVGNVLTKMPDGSYAYIFDITKSSENAPRKTVEGEVQAKRPVENISWYEALVFCNKLSMLSNLTPVYSINGKTDPAAWGAVPTGRNAAWDKVTVNWDANGYRLPTSTEWHVASQAWTSTAYYYGNDRDKLADHAWGSNNSSVVIFNRLVGYTHEVGKKLPNPWGLYDIYGNVQEWCWDWHSGVFPVGVVDPVGYTAEVLTDEGYRDYWGGSCNTDTSVMGTRSFVTPDYKSIYTGLRLVRSDSNPRIAAPSNPAGYVSAGYLLVTNPAKQLYKVGEAFDITGLVVHYQENTGIRRLIPNSELKFITSGTVELTQGRKFTTAGVKKVQILHKDANVATFEIKVIEDSDGKILDSGDFYLQIYGKYLYPVKASGTLWLELSDKKPDKPYNIKLINNSPDRGPEYTISYDGTYIAQPTSKDGAQLQSSRVPHMWRINQYAAFATIRDYGNQKLIVNASGQKKDNGTKVIVWSDTGSAPENAKITLIKAN